MSLILRQDICIHNNWWLQIYRQTFKYTFFLLIKDAWFVRRPVRVVERWDVSSPFVPVDTLEEVYKSLVQPYFEYCSPLWDNCGKLLKDKLERFQCRAARVLTGASYDIRSADLIQTLSWGTLALRWLLAKSTLMYKILNDDTASNLRNSFVRRNADQTDYHLRNSATDLTLPKPKRDFLKLCFKYRSAMPWLNQFPNEAKRYIHLINIKT